MKIQELLNFIETYSGFDQEEIAFFLLAEFEYLKAKGMIPASDEDLETENYSNYNSDFDEAFSCIEGNLSAGIDGNLNEGLDGNLNAGLEDELAGDDNDDNDYSGDDENSGVNMHDMIEYITIRTGLPREQVDYMALIVVYFHRVVLEGEELDFDDFMKEVFNE